jgi:TolB-like protein
MKKIFFLAAAVLVSFTARAQAPKESVAILDFDTRSYPVDVQQVLQKATIEMMRINAYEVIDKYDIEYIAKRDNVQLKGCFSKICLKDIGERLQCDYVITGSYDLLADKVALTVRLFEVKSGTFVNSTSRIYLNIPEQSLAMMEVSLNDLFKLPSDEQLVRKLTVSEDYESALNNPNASVINNNGPRIGLTAIAGPSASILTLDRKYGGFDYAVPLLSSFGYQFEQVFVNSGNFQALVEFIPLVAGLEYGRIIPSASVLLGMRNSRTGWEFAIGPNITSTVTGTGYYNQPNSSLPGHYESWMLRGVNAGYNANGKEEITRLDSRGDFALATGLIIGGGKTIKSGRMNFPINLFFVTPGRGDSWRIGASVGFNIVRKKTPRPMRTFGSDLLPLQGGF